MNFVTLGWFCANYHALFKYVPLQDFLRTTTITARMRSILINWLAQVSLQFKLLQETLYLTVDTVDRFLSLNGNHKCFIFIKIRKV